MFPHSGNTIVIIHSLSQTRVTDTHPYLPLSPHLGLLLVFIPFSPFSPLFCSTQPSSESCISHSPTTPLFWWDPANGRLQQEMGGGWEGRNEGISSLPLSLVGSLAVAESPLQIQAEFSACPATLARLKSGGWAVPPFFDPPAWVGSSYVLWSISDLPLWTHIETLNFPTFL